MRTPLLLKNWKQKKAAYEKDLAKPKQRLNGKSTDFPKIEELTSAASDLASNLASFQSEI